jgi:hypothetical protein
LCDYVVVGSERVEEYAEHRDETTVQHTQKLLGYDEE